MKIRKVILENIRSHKKTEIEFEDGFTCIVGGVGSGKSSILYAIHFGLLGERLGRSYSYLLKEGEERGLVSIEFEHRGKRYKVIRTLKRIGGRITQDPSELALYENGKIIASGKAITVNEQIKAITGVDRNLFKNVIWIQQEKLKELLNIEPSKRQETLDRLFGIADFIEAWKNFRQFESKYEGERDTYNRDPDILNFERLRGDYDEAYRRLVETQLKIEGLKPKVKEAEERYKKIEGELRRLEDLRKRSDELRNRIANLEAKISVMDEEVKRLEEQKSAKGEEISDLERQLVIIEASIKETGEKLTAFGLPPASSMEEIEGAIDSLREERSEIFSEKETVERELRKIGEQTRTLSEKGICPTCQRPLTDETRHSLLSKFDEERIEKERKYGEIITKLKRIEKEKEVINKILEDFQALIPQRERMQERINDELLKLEEIEGQLEEKRLSLIDFHEQLESLKAEYSLLEEARIRELSKRRDDFYKDYINLSLELTMQEKLRTEREKRVGDLEKRIRAVKEKLRRKEKVERILKVIKEIREIYKAIGPKLRKEFVKALMYYVQQILYDMMAETERQYVVEIDETYTPKLKEEEYWRDIFALSGGERTMLAFAYKIGIGQLIMAARGMTLDLLILDEPTESLGPEDRSIDRLAEALSRLRAVEQIIAVTHSEDFAKKAEHVIRIQKIAGESSVLIER